MAIVSGGVQYSGHPDNLRGFIHFVNHTVGKARRITPAYVFDRMPPTIEQRVFRQGIPNLDNFLDKLNAQSGLPGLIPVGSLRHILFDSRREFNTPTHLR